MTPCSLASSSQALPTPGTTGASSALGLAAAAGVSPLPRAGR